MWTPDVRTLFLILFLVNTVLTLMLFMFWKTQKTYYGFRTWMLGLLVISCGYFLFMLRGSASDFLSIIIANILIALSVIMRVDSSRRYFWSKPISPFFYCILIPFAAFFLYYTYSVDSVLLRSLISNMIIIPCLIITGILALRSQDPENRWLTSGFAASFMVVAMLLAVRTISWLITPQNQSLFSTDLVNSFYFVVTIITDILGTGFFIMLNMARSQRDLRVNEEKFRQLFTCMPSAGAIYDAVEGGKDFIIKDFNAAAEKIEGIKKDELIGKRVTQVFPGVKDFGVFDVFCRVWRTGQPEFFPSALYRDERDPGTWRESWVYRLASGEVVAIYHDITGRKRAEQELVSAQERLNEAHRLAHIGTWDWVIKNDTVTWSEELYNITGRDPSLTAPTYAEHPRVYTPASWDLLNNAVTRAFTTGEPYNLELELIRPDGSTRWTNAFGGVKRDGDGKVIGLHGTLQDITDRKLAEEALRETEERLSLALDGANLGLWDMNLLTGEMVHNRRWAEILGFSTDELENPPVWWGERVHPDDYQNVLNLSNLHRAGDVPIFNAVYRMRHKDGSWRWVHSQGKVVARDIEGRPLRMIGINEDITDRKLAEERIKDSETRFKHLFNNMGNGVAIYEVVGDGDDFIFRDFNRAAEEIDTISRQDVIGRSVLEIFPEVKEFGLFDVFQRVWRTGVHEQHPISQYLDNRISGWRDNYVYKLPSGEIVAIYEDVTDRKLAEEALRESEETFKALAENANDGILVAVTAIAHTYANRQAGEITGYRVAELLKIGIMDLAAPDEAQKIMERFRKRLSGEYVSAQYETTIIRKDGERVPVELSAAKTFWHGQPADLIIIHDITERKQAEERIRWLASFPELNPNPVIEMDAQGTITFANAATLKTLRDLGLPEDPALFVPENKEDILRLFWETGGPQIFREIILKNEIFAKDITLNHELRVVRFYIRNITDRKRADEALQIQHNLALELTTCHAQKEALELILDAALQGEDLDSGGIYVADPVTGALDIAVHRGLSQEFVEHTSHFDADALQLETAKTGIPFYGQYADIRQPGKDKIRDREELTALASIPVLHEGNLVAIMNMASHVHDDIPVHTRQLLETLAAQIGGALVYIRSEQALRESEEILQNIIEKNPMSIQIVDKDGFTLRVNSAHTSLFGAVPPSDFSIFNDFQLKQQGFGESIERVKNGEVVNFSDMYFNAHDSVSECPDVPVWVRGIMFPLLDTYGKPELFVLMHENITLRKRAEETLRETNEYLHKLIDFANAPIMVWDPAFRITRFNEAFENLTGLTEQEVIGQKIEILFPADSGEASLALIKETLEGGRWESVRIPVIAADGTTHTLLWNSANILSEGAELVSTIAQGVDITLSERAEKAMRESEKRYRSVVEDQTELICRFDPDGTLTFVNNAYCRYFDLREESCIGKRHTVVLPPDDVSLMKIHIQSLTRDNPVATLRHRIIMPSGEVRWQRWSDRAIFDNDGRVVEYQSVGRDITDVINAEKRLRESEEHYRLIADNTADNIWIFDMDMHMQYTSPSVEKMKGFTVEETLSMSLGEMMTPESLESVMKRFHQEMELEAWGTADPGRTISFETEEYCKSGRTILVENSVTLLRNTQGRPVGMLGISHDITERKVAEEVIRAALEEKEVLHQEIHHRVKNNLAGIISLIELQIGSLSDPVNISHLKDLEIRVRSMALVHESLYLTKDIEWVNIATYTENLVRYLVQVYGTATDIRCRTDIEDFMIPLKTAIPCGLVMSEIVTNALKYAFPKTFSCREIRGEPCTITISLKREGNDYLLKITDNGIGIPEGMDITASRTLGLFLIRLIVKHQLRGTLETSTAAGTAYTIRFSEAAGKVRHADE